MCASGPVLAQEDIQAKHAVYALCVEHIEKDPHKAFEYCTDYLNKYPNDNKWQTEPVGKFITAYKKISQWLKSVPANNFTEKKTFNNVYVANMTLTWGQVCGGLCGYGFTRNKIVVMSPSGEILEMFLDDPVNRMSWIS